MQGLRMPQSCPSWPIWWTPVRGPSTVPSTPWRKSPSVWLTQLVSLLLSSIPLNAIILIPITNLCPSLGRIYMHFGSIILSRNRSTFWWPFDQTDWLSLAHANHWHTQSGVCATLLVPQRISLSFLGGAGNRRRSIRPLQWHEDHVASGAGPTAPGGGNHPTQGPQNSSNKWI